jgi:preprotein translocase subunit SecD
VADAGPAGYGRRQGKAQPGPSTSTRGQYWADAEENNPSQFFKPSTHHTTHDGTQYPYTPYAPAQARPTPTQTLQAENEQLRKAIEAELQMRRNAEARLQQRAANTPAAAQLQEARPEEVQQRMRDTPAPAQFQETRLEGLQQSRHAPSVAQEDANMPLADQPMTQQQYQTSLLEQLAQLQIRLVNDRMDTRPNTRGPTNLKPADIGYFKPKAMPDSEVAMNFIESFTDAVIHYGEANTLAVL